MKKVIGILSVATLALAMFFNANAMNNTNNDFSLASLLTLNNANADPESCVVKGYVFDNPSVKYAYRSGNPCCEGQNSAYCSSSTYGWDTCAEWICIY